MELREMSESCENQEKDVTLNNNGATDAAETTKNENISGEDAFLLGYRDDQRLDWNDEAVGFINMFSDDTSRS